MHEEERPFPRISDWNNALKVCGPCPPPGYDCRGCAALLWA